MRKLLLLLAFAGLPAITSAQEVDTDAVTSGQDADFTLGALAVTEEFTDDASDGDAAYPTMNHQVITNNFLSNWFIDVNADFNSFFSSQERDYPCADGHHSPFWSGRSTWGFSFAAGKWATPVFGLRARVTGAWAKQVNRRMMAADNPTYRQWTLSLQPMLNLTKLFVGNKARLWEASVYVGAGMAVSKFDDGVAVDNNGNGLPARTVSSLLCSVGIVNTFNITRRYHINLDVSLSSADAGMDGNARSLEGKGITGSHDNIFSISLGVGVNLGKLGWKSAPDIDAMMSMQQAEIDALNASIQDMEAENERLRSEAK